MMCRIAGFWDLRHSQDYDLEKVGLSMRDSLTHGGPDDAGLYLDEKEGVALGNRRLSILDLSPRGHQPMEFDRYVITYNGEIYNFQEIRKELERVDYTFNSRSDTEVILKAFAEWGVEAFSKFRGMWAFAIWDKQDKTLMLCRDRIGVKPLYWYHRDGVFLFGSELKAFHHHPRFRKELDEKSLTLYLQYGYITTPYSIFKDTSKLEPGHVLTIGRDGKTHIRQYWDIEDHFLKQLEDASEYAEKPEQEIVNELEGVLKESFKLRMVADVPVGIFLSGGIDSTLVTALLQREYTRPLKTFTIGFHEEGYNEALYAKAVARYLGTDHTDLYCTFKEAADIVPQLPEIYDEPLGDSSAIPTILVSKLAKEQVKISLSADGGDEQFCGYPKYWKFMRLEKLTRIPGSAHLPKALKFISPDLLAEIQRSLPPSFPTITNVKGKLKKLRELLVRKDFIAQYDLVNTQFLGSDLMELGVHALINNNFKFTHWKCDGLDTLSKMMCVDLQTFLPDDILAKVDRATMSVGLEGREPFLDNRVVEYTSKLPAHFKYKEGTSKYLLKKILDKHIPRDLIDRPKMGFGVPVGAWLKTELKEWYPQYLNKARVEREGIFDADAVERLLSEYFKKNSAVNHNQLWFLFTFQQWKERWL